MSNIEISNTTITNAAIKHPLSVKVSGEQQPMTNSTIPRNANKKLNEMANAFLSLTILRRYIKIVVTIIDALVKQTLKGVYAVKINPNTTLSTSIRNAIIKITLFIGFTFEVELVEGIEARKLLWIFLLIWKKSQLEMSLLYVLVQNLF